MGAELLMKRIPAGIQGFLIWAFAVGLLLAIGMTVEHFTGVSLSHDCEEQAGADVAGRCGF